MKIYIYEVSCENRIVLNWTYEKINHKDNLHKYKFEEVDYIGTNENIISEPSVTWIVWSVAPDDDCRYVVTKRRV